MTDPATTATVHAIAGSGIMIAGLATGLPADLIFPSFIGALWALRTMENGGPWSRVLQVVAGTLLAAWSATPISLVAAEIVPSVAKVPHDLLRYPLAFVVGWGGLSLALTRAGKLLSGGQDK